MVHVSAPVDGVSGTASYEAIGAGGRAVVGPRVAVIARTHGNEPVGDPVLERLAAQLPERLVAGSVLTIRANEEGGRARRAAHRHGARPQPAVGRGDHGAAAGQAA